MVESSRRASFINHFALILGVIFTCLPVFYALIAATLDPQSVAKVPMPLLPGREFLVNAREAWTSVGLGAMFRTTLIVTLIVTIGKIVVSLMASFAIVYFRYPFARPAFWLIFLSLMIPVEVRIVPTFEVVANIFAPLQWFLETTRLDHVIQALSGVRVQLNLSLLNTYTGLTLPLMASATAVFLFRQFFLTVPDELADASKIDGASPWRFFTDILIPVSQVNIAAMFVILFVGTWNQYLWPLLVTTRNDMSMVAVGVKQLLPVASEQQPEYQVIMAGVVLVMLPPLLVIVLMQRFFVKGLVGTDK